MTPSRLALVLAVTLFIALGGGCAKSGPAIQSVDMAGRLICPENPTLCGGSCCGTECIDTSIDPRNCGGCGTQCEAGTVCANGKCGCLPSGAACGMGQSCCGTAGCKSTMSDINNCGACGKGCGNGATCEAGACKCGSMICTGTQICCNGVCAATCAGGPDMSAKPPCTCPLGCPFTGICIGPDCCFEDSLLLGLCDPDPSCTQSGP